MEPLAAAGSQGEFPVREKKPPDGPRAEVDQRVADLFVTCWHKVCRFACHIVRDPATAEDIGQQAFAKLLHVLRRGQVIRCPEAWLMRTARNEALNCLKRMNRRTYSLDPQCPVVRVIAPAAHGTPFYPLRPEDIHSLLQELTPRQQEVVVLRMRCPRATQLELAKRLGCTQSNVSLILGQSYRRIKAFLARGALR